MQQMKYLNEELLQNKTLERRNEELLKLLEAWQTKSQNNKPKFVKTIDMHEVENLIIRYYQVYKIPVSLYDESGKLLFSIGWKSICSQFHKNSPKNLSSCQNSVRHVQNNIADVNSFSFKCKNNINALAIPISVQKEILGTLVVSQFLYEDEVPDVSSMQEISYENEQSFEEFKKVFDELPILSNTEVEKLTEHYILFAEMIAFIASHNVQFQEHQNITKEKNDIIKIFKDKLEEQSLIIKAVHQIIIQQNQEIELMRSELVSLRRKVKEEVKEKSLV